MFKKSVITDLIGNPRIFSLDSGYSLVYLREECRCPLFPARKEGRVMGDLNTTTEYMVG